MINISENQQIKGKWYRTKWGIVLILILWPFFLSYWIWRKNWDNKTKVGIISIVWLVVIIVGTFQYGLVKTKSEDSKVQSPISIAHDNLAPQPTQIFTPTISITPYPTNLTTKPSETPESIPSPIPRSKEFNIVVTSLIVKKINNNFRYFFDIRNKDTEPFKGIVTITLYNTNDTFITEQGFDTKDLNSEKIEPGLGMSRYIDAHTGPPDYHQEFGVAKFKYKVMIDNQTVKEDGGTISSEREEISL